MKENTTMKKSHKRTLAKGSENRSVNWRQDWPTIGLDPGDRTTR